GVGIPDRLRGPDRARHRDREAARAALDQSYGRRDHVRGAWEVRELEGDVPGLRADEIRALPEVAGDDAAETGAEVDDGLHGAAAAAAELVGDHVMSLFARSAIRYRALGLEASRRCRRLPQSKTRC